MVWPRAALLDRDGVLNVNRADHVTEVRQWRWLPRAVESCARLAAAGIPIAIVTNQAAIARGLMTEDALQRIHGRMVRDLERAGVPAPVVLHCRHLPEARCEFRKPRPGMLLEAARRYRVNPRDCILVGDHEQDLTAAANAGCHSVHVRSGRGGFPANPPPRCLGSVADLEAAVEFVLARAHQFDQPWTSA